MYPMQIQITLKEDQVDFFNNYFDEQVVIGPNDNDYIVTINNKEEYEVFGFFVNYLSETKVSTQHLVDEVINQFVDELILTDKSHLQDLIYDNHPHLEESNDEFLELFDEYEKVAMSRLYKRSVLIEVVEMIDKNN